MPKINEVLFGKKSKVKQKTTQSAGQQEISRLVEEGLAQGTGAFGDIFGQFDEESFNKGIAQPSLKRFQEETLPAIFEKFAGGSLQGSGARRSATRAATDFQSKLAELLYNAKQQHTQNRIAGLQTELGVKPFENVVKEGSKGVVPALAQGAGQAAFSAIAG